MNQIPILVNHDQRAPVGFVTVGENGRLVLRVQKGITDDMLHAAFGRVGYRTLRMELRHGVRYIFEAEILEWSLPETH